MSCKHCTFNDWIAPYETDKNPVKVCGAEWDNHGDYVLAYRDGTFAVADYWTDRSWSQIFYCPYCGAKLERPADEIFDKAEREFREYQKKAKIKEYNEKIKALERKRDEL